MKQRTLSKEQIIDVANASVRAHGLDLKRFNIVYDEGNAAWRSAVKIPVPELEGRDYQLVMYMPRAHQLGGDLWVVVDRNTGEVLKTVKRG